MERRSGGRRHARPPFASGRRETPPCDESTKAGNAPHPALRSQNQNNSGSSWPHARQTRGFSSSIVSNRPMLHLTIVARFVLCELSGFQLTAQQSATSTSQSRPNCRFHAGLIGGLLKVCPCLRLQSNSHPFFVLPLLTRCPLDLRPFATRPLKRSPSCAGGGMGCGCVRTRSSAS